MSSQNRIDFTFGAKVDQASFKQVQNQLTNLLLSYERRKVTGGLTPELEKAKTTATQLQTILNKSYNSNLGSLNMTTFNQELNKSKINLQEFKAILEKGGAGGAAAWNNMASQILQTHTPIKKTNKLLDEMFSSIKNVVKYNISAGIFNKLAGEVSHAFNFVEELDKSLNNIQIVTENSAENMKDFAQWANEAAKNLSASTTDITNAALIYAQQGDSDEDIKRKAEITTKVSKVTGQDESTSADQLTAVWNGYQASAEQQEEYASKMAVVGAKTASSFAEIAAAMQKVASAGSTLGVDFDQLNAQIATIVSTTREAPESVGTALKTVYARMEDLKAGGTVDDGDGFSTSLGDVSSKLSAMGVNVLDTKGELKDLGSVIEEVGSKWQTWNKNQKTAAAQAIAGKRQYTQLFALFENFDQYMETKGYVQNADGALDDQFAIYEDSLQAAQDRLAAAKESIYQDLFDPEAAHSILDVFTEVINAIDRIIESFGGGTNALAIFGVMSAKVFSKQIGDLIAVRQYNKDIAKQEKDKAVFIQKQLGKKTANAQESQQQTQKQIQSYRQKTEQGTATERDAQQVNQQIALTAADKGSEIGLKTRYDYQEKIAKYASVMSKEALEGAAAQAEKVAQQKEIEATMKEQNRLIREKLGIDQEDFNVVEKMFDVEEQYNRDISDIDKKISESENNKKTIENNTDDFLKQDNNINVDGLYNARNNNSSVLYATNETTTSKKLKEWVDSDLLTDSQKTAANKIIEQVEAAEQRLAEIKKSDVNKKELTAGKFKDTVTQFKYGNETSKTLIAQEAENLSDLDFSNAESLENGIKARQKILDKCKDVKGTEKDTVNALQAQLNKLKEVLQYMQTIENSATKIKEAVSATAEDDIAEEDKKIDKEEKNKETTTQKFNNDNNDLVNYQNNQLTQEDARLEAEQGEQILEQTFDSNDKIAVKQNLLDGVTNSVTALSSAVSIYQQLGSIWNQDDVSIGERVLQTITSVLPMVIMLTQSSMSAITAFKDVWKYGMAAGAGATAAAAGEAAAGTAGATAAPALYTFAAGLYAALGPAGLVMIALAALVGAIALVAANMEEEATATEKAAAAHERYKESINTLTELNKQYKELKESLASLSEQETALDNMVKGTDEWRDAVFELNNQVLELIENYKGLQYTVDADGVYHITESSKQQVMEEQRNRISKQQIAVLEDRRDANTADYKIAEDKATKAIQKQYLQYRESQQSASDEQGNPVYKNINPDFAVNFDLSKTFDNYLEQMDSVLSGNESFSDLSEEDKASILQTLTSNDKILNNLDTDADSLWKELISSNQELITSLKDLTQTYKETKNNEDKSYTEEAKLALSQQEAYNNASEEDKRIMEQKWIKKQKEYEKKQPTLDDVDFSDSSSDNEEKIEQLFGKDTFQEDSDSLSDDELQFQNTDASKQLIQDYLAQKGVNIDQSNISIDDNTGELTLTGINEEQANLIQQGLGEFENGALKLGDETSDWIEASKSGLYAVKESKHALEQAAEIANQGVVESDREKYKNESSVGVTTTDINNTITNSDAREIATTLQNQLSMNDLISLNQQAGAFGQDYLAFIKNNKNNSSQIIQALKQTEDIVEAGTDIRDRSEIFADELDKMGIALSDVSGLEAFNSALDNADSALGRVAQAADSLTNAWSIIEGKNIGDTISAKDAATMQQQFGNDFEKYFAYAGGTGDKAQYIIKVDADTLQQAFHKSTRMEDDNAATTKEQRQAYAATFDNAGDLLSSRLNTEDISNQIDVISAKMIAAGNVTQEQLDTNAKKAQQYNKKQMSELSQQIKLLKNKKKQNGELTQSEEKQLKLLQKQRKIGELTNEEAKAYAANIAQIEQSLTELGKNWNKYNKALSSGKKGSKDYKDATKDVKSTFQTLYGNEDMQIGDFINDDFIANHREQIDKMLQGDKDAYYALGEDIAKEYAKNALELNIKDEDALQTATNDINSWIDSLPEPKLGVSLDQSYIQQMRKFIQDGKITVDQAQALFNSLGWDPELKTKKIKVPDIDPSKSGIVKDKNGNVHNIPVTITGTKEIEITTFGIKGAKGKGSGSGKNYIPPSSDKSSNKSSGDKGKQADKGGQKIKPEQDPYNHINAQLEDIDDKLSEIQSKAEHVSGKQYIQDLNKQNDLLDKQMRLYRKKEEIAKKILKEDKADIKKYGKKLGVNVTSEDYDEDGNLKNVDSLRKKAANKYNKALKKYKKKYGGKKKLKGKKLKAANKAKKKLDKYKDTYDDFDTAINEYQSDESERDEIRSLRQDALQQKIQNQIEAYTYKITATVDRQQLKKDIEDTRIQIETAFQGDDDYIGKLNSSIKTFTASMKFATSSMSNAVTGLKHVATLMKGKQDNVYSAKDSDMSESFVKEATEQAKEYLDTYKSNLDEALSDAQTMWSSFLDTINNSTTKINDYSAALDNLNSIIDSMISVMEMFGNQEGANFLKELQKYQSQQAQSAKEQVKLYNDPAVLKSLQKNYDDYAKKAVEATDETYKQLYAQARDAAGQQLMDYRKMGAEKIADAAEKSIKVILTKYNQKIVEMFTFAIGGQEKTLQQIKEAYDWLQETSDRYLDDVNKQYSINSFKRAAEQALKDNESLTAQQRISAVYQQQLEILQSQDKLTQRQVDRANDLLQLELKRLALEEARDNKNKMKLRRDASGNYSYQYVADEEDIDKAQQEYDAAQNELYNKDKAEVKRLTDLVFSDLSGFQEGLKGLKDNTEIYDEKGNIINQEAYQKEYQKLIDQYAPHLADSMTSLNTMLGNLFSEEDIANWGSMTDEQKQSIAQSAGIDNVQLIDGLLNGTFGDLDSITKWMTDGSSGLAAILGQATATTDDYLKMMEEHENETNETIKSVFGDNSSVLTETKEILEQINGKHLADIAQDISALLQSYKEDYLPLMQEYLAYTRMQAAGVTGTATAVKDKDGNITGYTTTGTSTSSSSKGGSVKYGNNHSFKYDSTKTTVNKTIDKNGTVKTTGSSTKYMQKGGRFLIQNDQNHKVVEKSWSNGKIDKGDTPTITTNDKLYARVKQDGVKKGGKKKGSTEYKWQALPVSGIKGEKVTIASSNKATAWGVNSKQDVKMVQIQSDNLGPYFGGTTLYIPEKYLQGFDTGGYTGEWVNGSAHDNGRLALLHQKEIVLNESDTSNLLKSIGMLRDMSGLLKSLDNSRNELFSRFMIAESRFTASAAPKDEKATVQQNVTINADFPNANNAIEIERALNNVINTAWQQVGEF